MSRCRKETQSGRRSASARLNWTAALPNYESTIERFAFRSNLSRFSFCCWKNQARWYCGRRSARSFGRMAPSWNSTTASTLRLRGCVTRWRNPPKNHALWKQWLAVDTVLLVRLKWSTCSQQNRAASLGQGFHLRELIPWWAARRQRSRRRYRRTGQTGELSELLSSC